MAAQRREKGTGSYWQDKHGQWWAKATRDGRTIRARAVDRADAKAKAKALAGELTASDIDTARMPMRAWLSHWIDTVEASGRVKPSTIAFYRRHCEYMISHIGKTLLGRLEPRHVRAMLAALGAGGLSPRSVAHVRAVLANSLNMAIKDKAIRDNAAQLADAPQVEDYPAYALSVEEQRRLIDAVDGVRRRVRWNTWGGIREQIAEGRPPHRLAAFAHLALGLGLRRGELLALAWRDIDFDAGLLVVRESKTKAGQGRILPLTAHLVAVLRAHLAMQTEEAQAARADAALAGLPAPLWNSAGLVFCSDVGSPVSESNFSARTFKTWLAWAGLPGTIRVHDLRHTFATMAAGAGGDIKSVQTLMGHADPMTTLRIYAHAQADRLRPVVEAAEAARRSG